MHLRRDGRGGGGRRRREDFIRFYAPRTHITAVVVHDGQVFQFLLKQDFPLNKRRQGRNFGSERKEGDDVSAQPICAEGKEISPLSLSTPDTSSRYRFI